MGTTVIFDKIKAGELGATRLVGSKKPYNASKTKLEKGGLENPNSVQSTLAYTGIYYSRQQTIEPRLNKRSFTGRATQWRHKPVDKVAASLPPYSGIAPFKGAGALKYATAPIPALPNFPQKARGAPRETPRKGTLA